MTNEDDLVIRLRNIDRLKSTDVWSIIEEAADRIEELERYLSTRHTMNELEKANKRNDKLEEALIRLRDCDWIITAHDRMDAVREIARKALGDGK